MQGFQWVTCFIDIDDIIVYGRSFDEHVKRAEKVLERLKAAGQKLKPDKCNRLKSEVVFMGHVISAEGTRPNPTNINKILE